jgi:hypothetical protein
VEALIVEELARFPGMTFTAVARKFKCHRRTVVRIAAWVCGPVEPPVRSEAYVELAPSEDPPPLTEAMPPLAISCQAPTPTSAKAKAPIPEFRTALSERLGLVLAHLDRVSQRHRDQGATLAAGSPLVAVLRHHFVQFRTVCYLNQRLSTAMLAMGIGPGP